MQPNICRKNKALKYLKAYEDLLIVTVRIFIISGSHNSGTSDLDPTIGIAVDQSKTLQSLGKCCCVIPVIHRWSKTQNLSIKEQLEAGIRYLDIRIAVHPLNNDFCFVHGLYGGPISSAMDAVKTFLEKNRKEIVILDFNHFYNMDLTDHENLLRQIISTFDAIIIHPVFIIEHDMTLTSLWNKKGRVIICYQNDISSAKYNLFWPKNKMESRWPNKNSSEFLISFHENIYGTETRSTTDFYIWQGVLTPTGKDIFTHLCGSLEESFSANGSEAFVTWLKQKKPGEKEINICYVDFVEKHDFIPSVIDLNNKILKN
ncbi:hypothetical protein CHS0354_008995 [Potamilus streckersoni]|uniref:Phosphatidylinositol-specific phospholipase C X domain-containing protein n=1 Tax=Potamilus streckersoni TaxID=2493646 RepID=A0AAE0WDU2_9BIVA|nr:hypothetical protein CHS0354_008995 [Potamilus streckersoni]